MRFVVLPALDMPIPTEEERVGTKLTERYELRSIVGRGGMGVVYDAVHTYTGRRVAIKLLRPEVSEDPKRTARLMTEARAAGGLQHPGIVDVLDMGVVDGCLYLALEFLEGEDLQQRLERGPVSHAEAVGWMCAILEALEVAHAAGVVHRDIKPSNLMLAHKGDAVMPTLLDFGIAKMREGDGHTTTGAILGTPYYMSPEAAAGDVVTGPSTDVWSAAVVLYECLSGGLPYDGASATGVLMNVLRHPAKALDLPDAPHVAKAVMRALSKDGDRFVDARAFRTALSDAAQRDGLFGADAAASPAGAPASGAPSPTAHSAAIPKGSAARPEPQSTLAETPSATAAPTMPPGRRRLGLVFGAVALVGASALAWTLVAGSDPVPTRTAETETAETETAETEPADTAPQTTEPIAVGASPNTTSLATSTEPPVRPPEAEVTQATTPMRTTTSRMTTMADSTASMSERSGAPASMSEVTTETSVPTRTEPTHRPSVGVARDEPGRPMLVRVSCNGGQTTRPLLRPGEWVRLDGVRNVTGAGRWLVDASVSRAVTQCYRDAPIGGWQWRAQVNREGRVTSVEPVRHCPTTASVITCVERALENASLGSVTHPGQALLYFTWSRTAPSDYGRRASTMTSMAEPDDDAEVTAMNPSLRTEW